MNFAFPALLIFLLVLPGLIFNLAFYKTEHTPLKDISFTHKAIVGSAIAITLHAIWLCIFIDCLKFSININILLILISGAQGEKYAEALSTLTAHQIILTAIYLLSLYVIAYLLGKGLRILIRYFKLDEKFDLFRIDSPWYYLFTGYDWESGKPDGVFIAATVEISNKGYLYTGWLHKFFLDNKGNIDRLVLTGAMRRNIENDKQKANDQPLDRFYSIDGDYFVLKYMEIKSLNVQFLKLEN